MMRFSDEVVLVTVAVPGVVRAMCHRFTDEGRRWSSLTGARLGLDEVPTEVVNG